MPLATLTGWDLRAHRVRVVSRDGYHRGRLEEMGRLGVVRKFMNFLGLIRCVDHGCWVMLGRMMRWAFERGVRVRVVGLRKARSVRDGELFRMGASCKNAKCLGQIRPKNLLRANHCEAHRGLGTRGFFLEQS